MKMRKHDDKYYGSKSPYIIYNIKPLASCADDLYTARSANVEQNKSSKLFKHFTSANFHRFVKIDENYVCILLTNVTVF